MALFHFHLHFHFHFHFRFSSYLSTTLRTMTISTNGSLEQHHEKGYRLVYVGMEVRGHAG
jgi:hypothetical protein